MELSLAEQCALNPELLSDFTNSEKQELLYSWQFWGRPKQLEPSNYFCWLIMSGRGFGKTWIGSQWVLDKAKKNPGCHIGLIGESAADVRDIMIEKGSSSILKIASPSFYPVYEPSKRSLTFPNNSVCTAYSADKPDLLRGPNHHFLWMDELAKYRNYQEVYDMAMFGLRLGDKPQLLVTTTPKPLQLLKNLIKDNTTHLTTGSTYENRSNLANSFLEIIQKKYEGSSLGQQELYGVLLDEAEGALFSRKQIDETRKPKPTEFDRIVIGVDVAVTVEDNSDETGIVVCGSLREEGYVLDDLSGRLKPSEMAEKVLDYYHNNNVDMIVIEANNGGDFIIETIRLVEKQKGLSPALIKKVWASKSKKIRASVIQPLYEQKGIHHTKTFNVLEDQMCTWIPGDSTSPDRLDALVWGLTELFIKDFKTEQYNNPW